MRNVTRCVSISEEMAQAQKVALEATRRSEVITSYVLRRSGYSFDLSDRIPQLVEILVPTTLLMLAIIYFMRPNFVGNLLGISLDMNGYILLFALGIISFIPVWLRVMFQNRVIRRTGAATRTFDSEIGMIVIGFSEIISDLRPQVAEEISYFIGLKVIEMPPDTGMRYMRDFLEKFEIGGILSRQILAWSQEFLSLSPMSRRAVVEQIRRQTLTR